MAYQGQVDALSIAANVHQSRISAFISAFDEAGDQADRFDLAEEYCDIFGLYSDPETNDIPASARVRLVNSGAVTLLTSLIISDAAHRIVRKILRFELTRRPTNLS